MKNYTIGFYLEKLYFFPQFDPVIKELIKCGISYVLIIPKTLERDMLNQREKSIRHLQQINYEFLREEEDCKCDVMVFGNTPRPIHTLFKKSALINHGVWGGKTVDIMPGLNQVDLRFIDGKFLEEYLCELYPEKKSIFHISGYSKLDTYFTLKPEDKPKFLQQRNLDINKKTILYAPTFYPSSILKMGKKFPQDLKDYNIIIKPHSNLYLRKTYSKDLRRLQSWSKYPNVYLAGFEETDAIPFLHAADLLISDMSSIIYEFAGVGKPVITNLFLRYRWYHHLLRYKITKRLDTTKFFLWEVGDTPRSYAEMLKYTVENLENPDKNKKKREELVRFVVGEVDGQVSSRIVDKLIELNTRS